MKKVSGILVILLSCASCSKDYSGYQRATGQVSYVYGRQASGGPGYRIRYCPPGSNKIITVDGYLELSTYEKGDSVQIWYDPGDPAADVIDEM